MAKSRVAASHVEWLGLVETTGIFLTVPVVRRVFPSGIGTVADDLRSELRLRLASADRTQAWATGWTRWVLRDLLGLAPALLEGQAVPDRATHLVAEHGVLLRPEYAVADVDGADPRPLRMTVLVFPLGTARDRPVPGDRWAATPIERALALQRATGVPLVMATDGDWFTVVANPPGGTATSATWVSSIFGEEPVLLDSFAALLGARRFFAVSDENRLPEMLEASAQAQEEVTTRLGTQVRQATELLVGALSRANRARHGELLAEVSAETVYAAALTVMMRTVFLLYAEERDLLPAREALYADSYGVMGLRERLQDEADRFGEEALERRSAGWHQLLAAFRAIHGGIEHEALRLPAYGGGLFDPDRYPFLEGRKDGEPWRTHESRPMPVDDRTVLAILGALQILTFRDGGVVEARRLSYRSLDVEQIGHVYEGLLDHGAVKVDDLAVGLRGSTSDGPEIAVELLEEAAAKGHSALVKLLVEESGRSATQIEKGLALKADATAAGRLRSACEHRDEHVDRVLPYLGLMEEDLRGLPMVFLPGSVYVTRTTERRDTGTQYTPKDLADEIVRYALEPLVYSPGPAEGADPPDWRIKRPEEILALRVCDPAVGSGAILVAACRYLSERLIESVAIHEPGAGERSLLAADDPDAALIARRLVVDHCLYGVDRNPLAAEMAKLSLWLVTLAKERPFTFLDHAIRVGDSLFGVTHLDQVLSLHLDPSRGRRLHGNLLQVGRAIQPLVAEAVEWIRAMRRIDPVSVADVEDQRTMSTEAGLSLARVEVIANAVIGRAVAATRRQASLDDSLADLSLRLNRALDVGRSQADRESEWRSISDDAAYDLNVDRPAGAPPRNLLHWPLAFPEVFAGDDSGFDSLIGNPPFLGGQRISGTAGDDYREYLVANLASGRRGSADLVAYFFLRCAELLSSSGTIGLFATDTIAQGDTREVGLDHLTETGWTIYRATPTREWPGSANVYIAQVWLRQGRWAGQRWLADTQVGSIDTTLTAASRVSGRPFQLAANRGQAFQGSNVLGTGFSMTPEEAAALIKRDGRNREVLFPYLNGEDLTSSPRQEPSRWVIHFRDWPEDVAAGYPDCYDIVSRLVRPDRANNADPRRRKYWWQFTRPTPELYAAIKPLDRVIVLSRVSKFTMPVLVPNGQVFSDRLAVFAYGDVFHLGVLSSSLHTAWAVRYSGTLGLRLNYSTADAFETFPFPTLTPEVEVAARELEVTRRRIMDGRAEGLTKTYNRMNDPAEDDKECRDLRLLHITLDCAVAAAYGWEDLDLAHGFHETRLGVRYTIGPGAQAEILDRLLELNHARYAREQAEHAARTKGTRRRRAATPGQLGMMGDD